MTPKHIHNYGSNTRSTEYLADFGITWADFVRFGWFQLLRYETNNKGLQQPTS